MVKADTLNPLLDFTSVWSTALNKLLVIGGRRFDPKVFLSTIYADTPSTEHCEVSQTIRVRPSPRVFFCAAQAYGGSSIVFFGVYGPNPIQSVDHSEVYMLISSLEWTRLSNRGSNYARGSPTCAIDHGQVIIWGGGVQGTPISLESLMIFNLKTHL